MESGATDYSLMQQAYDSHSGFAVGYVAGRKTLAIAGTRDMRDWMTDAAYIFGLEGFVPGNRFTQAEKTVQQVRPQRIIGHSLGGAVASRYKSSTGYNPFVSPVGPSAMRQADKVVRRRGDLVSWFSRNPRNMPGSYHPLDAHRMPVV